MSGRDAPASFDAQASRYEARTGLPPEIGRAVADVVAARVREGGVIVDVGAGTGTVGRFLVGRDRRYVGLDASAGMLAEFARVLGPLGPLGPLGNDATSAATTLVAMDANATWPVAARSVDAVLFSRSLHLLEMGKIVDEVVRVARAGGCVWVGRVRKHEDSAPERLRQKMQDILRAHDGPGRNGQRARREFLAQLARRGTVPIAPWTSAPWFVEQSAREAIEAWRGKAGLGGRNVPPDVKDKILDELTEWAARELGDLDAVTTVERRFEIEGAQLG